MLVFKVTVSETLSVSDILILKNAQTYQTNKTKTFSSSLFFQPGHVAQSVGHLTRKSGVLGLIPGQATYFRFSFRFFKKGSCQLLAKVCARSTG